MLALILCLFLGDPPTEEQQKAAALVRQLGDRAFRKREAAAKELIALGGISRAALVEGLKNSDPEIRERCGRLIPLVWEEDFKVRIDRLQKDNAGAAAIDLPGWDRLAKCGGNEPALKEKFAKVMNDNKSAIKVLECTPTGLSSHYESRLVEILGLDENYIALVRGGASLSDLRFKTDELIFWLLAMSEPRIVEAARSKEGPEIHYLANLLKEATFARHSKDPTNKSLLDSTIASVAMTFISSRENTEILSACFDLAESCGFMRVADSAAAYLSQKGKPQTLEDRAMGILGRFGQTRHLTVLVPYLNDTRVMSDGYFAGYTTQYRDFALAMSLKIMGESPKAFGFTFATNRDPPKAYSYGFKSDANRAKTFEMYADYLRK